MTLSSQTSKQSYNATSGVVAFPFTFSIIDETDLVITVRDADGVEYPQTLTTHYTVGTLDVYGQGTVTFLAAPYTTYGAGSTITLERSIPFTQEADFVEGDSFSPEVLEGELDKQVMLLQQLNKTQADRCLKIPTSSTASPDFPDPATNQGKGIRITSGGTGIEAYELTSAVTVNLATIGDYTDFATMITEVGSTEKTIIVDTAAAVDDDATIPATMRLDVIKGGSLVIATGKVLTVNGTITAGRYQIFSGAGTVSFGGAAMVYPEWWGFSSATSALENIAALNAMSTALANHGVVDMIPGTYPCNGNWTVDNPCVIHWNDAALTFSTDAANQGVILTSGDVIIYEPRLVGPQFASMDETQVAIRAYGTYNAGTAPDFVGGIKIYGGNISNWSRGFNWDYIEDFEIAGTKFHDLWYDGIRLGSCRAGRVHEALIKNVVATVAAYGIHVTVSQDEGRTVTTDPASQNIIVSACDVYDVLNWEGFDTHGGNLVKFVGCNAYNCFIGINLTSVANNYDASEEYPIIDCAAVGCSVYLPAASTSTSHGITDNGLATVTGMALRTVLQGNHISGPYREGIYSRYNKGSNYSGNTITGCTTYGLRVLYSIENMTATGNTVGPLASGATAPVYFDASTNIDSGLNNGLFAGNTIDADGCNYGVYNSASGFVDYKLRGNHIKNFTTGPYYMDRGLNWEILINTTPHSTDGTDEDTLTSLVLVKDSIKAGDVLSIHAAGTKSGTAGAKTIKLRLGTSDITIDTGATGAGDWSVDAQIIFTAVDSQIVSWVGHGTSVASGHDVLSEDISAGSLTHSVRSQCANGADSVTQTMMLIRKSQRC